MWTVSSLEIIPFTETDTIINIYRLKHRKTKWHRDREEDEARQIDLRLHSTETMDQKLTAKLQLEAAMARCRG